MFRVVTAIGAGAGLIGVFCLKPHSSQKFIASSEPSVTSSETCASTVDSFYKEPLPSRAELLEVLQDVDKQFDVLVIGGGATGAGVALDACTRGLKCALVEKDDYSSGTSSKSTKLLHGGVRYLQSAIMKLDKEQYLLVKEALAERAHVLASAPHLSSALPIMLPIYKWWLVPYYWAGIKVYDVLAGRQIVKSSYFLRKKKALEVFPTLKSEKLAGAIVYYDGQQDDARMNLSIIMSAIRSGATCLNHTEVKNLLFEEDEEGAKRVCGAHVRDVITGVEWDVKAKCVINATGPFTDSIRKMSDSDVKEICQPSAGVHLTLPHYYCSREFGLLDPETKDGRIIFVLPWEGKTIAGTTDRKCDVTFNPEGTTDEINFIMEEVGKYLNPDVEVRKADILSSWCGIRPLVTDPSSNDTQSLSRNHVIEVSASKLVSIAGGKWTTYRAMARDALEAAIQACNLSPASDSCTDKRVVEGGLGWTQTYYIRLVQEYGLEAEVAQHLSRAYGTKAHFVAKLAANTGKRWPAVGRRLVDNLPYIEADVLYAVKHEYACKVVDVISRRMRMSFLDVEASREMLPKIIELMSNELEWSEERQAKEALEAEHLLQSMNYKHIYKEDVVGNSCEEGSSSSIMEDLHQHENNHNVGIEIKSSDVDEVEANSIPSH